ncbi:hypothetical protein M409DRAFT_29626 [Zasmidium cellare ATCC 36951]|uniref:Uncharacterized protein n=1 Tax=Zasmidium cellare ATCC 36951 TaxID=1080233 RepID=A0A6A6BYC8_ZASCE|nr:uncharacterized protein M409DRAFT_29626 [Zasmidium cellare ATCC 36951]KAF2159814.1 hypothetical protein M409DRAFT_29626 [Zasmidium cellare ATCC 36951]
MFRSLAHLVEDDERLNVQGVTDIAKKMTAVATFITNEYCTGLQALSLPTQKLFHDLVDRLLNYGWPLVSPGSSHKLDLPGEKNVLEPKDAFRAMEKLAGFFDRRARSFREVRLDVLREVRLSRDLRFAARYTEALVAGLDGVGEVEAVGEGGHSEQAEDSEQVERTSEETATEDSNDKPLESQEVPEGETEERPSTTHHHAGEHTAPASETELRPVSKGLSFKGPYVVENVAWQPALASVQEDELSTVSSSLESRAQAATKDDVEAHKAPALGDCPDAVEVPRELKGRRLTSRCWFETNPKFADLIGEIKQWKDDAPNYDFTTIRGRGDLENLVHHFCDATPLGISALFIIKCEHPLDPAIVGHLDMDILRFVRLLLWDWTNGRAERRAERESLEVVRREIRVRKGEIAGEEARAGDLQPRGDLGGEVLFDYDEADGRSEAPADIEEEQEPAPLRPQIDLGGEQPVKEASPSNHEPESSFEAPANIEDEQQPVDLQAYATNEDSTEEGLDLSAAWLNESDYAPDQDCSSIREATVQPMIPVTLPTECAVRIPESFKTVKPTTSRESDDFTTLLRRSTLAALGVSTGSTQPLATVSPKIVSLVETERNARLEWENAILREQISELQQQLESLRPLDAPEKGCRTDDCHAHPLQHLVGQRERNESPSMDAEVDSNSDDRLDSDEDLKRYSRNDFMSMLEFLNSEPPPSPSRRASRSSGDGSTSRWAHSFSDMMSKIKRPGRASRNHSTVYEGEYGAPDAYVPTRALKSSRGRSRIQPPGREANGGGDPLNSEHVSQQPGSSMKTV